MQVRTLGQEFLPGKFLEQGNLAGYSPWGCKASDKIESLSMINIGIIVRNINRNTSLHKLVYTHIYFHIM